MCSAGWTGSTGSAQVDCRRVAAPVELPEPARAPSQPVHLVRQAAGEVIAAVQVGVSALVSAFFVTVFKAQPQVQTSDGQKFFDNYYRGVTQADQRRALYQKDLTP